MKETKVYINKMPESCWDCFCQDNENGRCKILGKYTDYVPKDCPLIDIKAHDLELVKEVCEKIRNAVNKSLEEIGGNCNGELYGQYICKGLVDYDSIEFAEILDQIQKEYEK